MTISEIADHVVQCIGKTSDRRSISRALEDLEQRGLVINQSLGRTNRYALTEKGEIRCDALVDSLTQFPVG